MTKYSPARRKDYFSVEKIFKNSVYSQNILLFTLCFLILLYIGLTPFNFGQQKILPPKTSEEGSVINIQFFHFASPPRRSRFNNLYKVKYL